MWLNVVKISASTDQNVSRLFILCLWVKLWLGWVIWIGEVIWVKFLKKILKTKISQLLFLMVVSYFVELGVCRIHQSFTQIIFPPVACTIKILQS